MDFKTLFDQYLRLVNRFLFKSKVVPLVTIDIGAHALKALDMNFSTQGVVVRRFALEPLEGKNPVEVLKNLAERWQLDDQIIISSVSGKGSMIRYIEAPRMPLEDLRRSLAFEMDKHFPFDPHTIYTDCAILDPDSRDKKCLVLLAAVKKEIVQDRLNLFKESGLELDKLTLNAIALGNAFSVLGEPALPSSNAKAVMDIGASMSSLLIFKGPSVHFARDIFIGSQQWTNEMVNTLGLTEAQAENLKIHPEANPGPTQILEACEVSINHLITEMRLSMDYFMNEKNVLIDELFICGGGALLNGIDSTFEKNLGVRVKIWDPLGGKSHIPIIVPEENIHNYAQQMMVALGLGL